MRLALPFRTPEYSYSAVRRLPRESVGTLLQVAKGRYNGAKGNRSFPALNSIRHRAFRQGTNKLMKSHPSSGWGHVVERNTGNGVVVLYVASDYLSRAQLHDVDKVAKARATMGKNRNTQTERKGYRSSCTKVRGGSTRYW